MDPMLVVLAVPVVAFAAAVGLAVAGRPRSGRKVPGGTLHSDDVRAQIEAVDIDQMIEARNERRLRAGREEIGEELGREALRRPPAR